MLLFWPGVWAHIKPQNVRTRMSPTGNLREAIRASPSNGLSVGREAGWGTRKRLRVSIREAWEVVSPNSISGRQVLADKAAGQRWRVQTFATFCGRGQLRESRSGEIIASGVTFVAAGPGR